MDNWSKYHMPDDMAGKTFLDVGCWEGLDCVEAVKRGAARVVGIDLCTCEKLLGLVKKHDFVFLQMDVFSDAFLALRVFDVVLCSRVFHHVWNPIGLLVRLRKVTGKILFLETIVSPFEKPALMQFIPQHKDASIWWYPNEVCLIALLEVCGFGDVEIVYKQAIDGVTRLCAKAVPIGYMPHEKMLVRKEDRMSLYGGHR